MENHIHRRVHLRQRLNDKQVAPGRITPPSVRFDFFQIPSETKDLSVFFLICHIIFRHTRGSGLYGLPAIKNVVVVVVTVPARYLSIIIIIHCYCCQY